MYRRSNYYKHENWEDQIVVIKGGTIYYIAKFEFLLYAVTISSLKICYINYIFPKFDEITHSKCFKNRLEIDTEICLKEYYLTLHFTGKSPQSSRSTVVMKMELLRFYTCISCTYIGVRSYSTRFFIKQL